MVAVSLPWPDRSKPRPAPAVAAPTAEIVVVELTRPDPDAFRVRVRPEGVDAPSGPIAELHVFYAARVEEISEELTRDWKRRGMRPTAHVRANQARTFDFAAGFGVVAWVVELLARRFAP